MKYLSPHLITVLSMLMLMMCAGYVDSDAQSHVDAGHAEEVATVDARFRRAWSQADIEFQPSRFNAFLAGREGR